MTRRGADDDRATFTYAADAMPGPGVENQLWDWRP